MAAPKKFLQNIFFKQRSEDALQDAGLFLALFTLFFSLANLVLGSLTGKILHYLAANTSILALRPLGIAADVVPNAADGFPHLLGEVRRSAFDAQINDLCSGATELAVVFAIVLASRDKSVRTRLLGVFGALIVFLLFNPLRIALTLNAVGTWALPLLHDVLFRASLVLVIVGYYGFWYYATPSKAGGGRH